MNVLLIGSGGREYTLAWKLAQSSKLGQLYIAPGNGGTSAFGINVPLKVNDFDGIKKCVLENSIQLVVVGPEAPLVEGITDFFKADAELQNVAVIGPDQQGATLEGSKEFAKAFMAKYDIPTAKYESFKAETLEQGKAFLETLNAPYVLKADGLAAGKGVLILDDLEEAKSELSQMLSGKFGAAGDTVVIEEFLSGIELSVFVLTDGKDYVILPEAKDYKRIGEGDTGLNTGGMGAVTPVPFAQGDFLNKVEERIVKPTIQGISAEGMDYKGFVFIGLMNVNGDPYVIEYNVRMGDPETEVVIPRVKSDLLELFQATAKGELSQCTLELNPDTAVTVMLVSGGYPEAYAKGKVIEGADVSVENGLTIHAGTTEKEGNLLTSGGRVISCTAYGKDIEEARKRAYNRVDQIKFEGMYYRKDIGLDLL
ncbi:phosphoribosylamine--glycine ligase [bacterium SCSIO 12741]|nr:phosphoribosylamine--glycine ligase [bacterium SCSIO 12741]